MKISILAYCLISVNASVRPITVNPDATMPIIEVVGPSSNTKELCLPTDIPVKEFDPMRPEGVESYEIPKFDESEVASPGPIDDDIKALLDSLTVEEKIGQMAQLTPDMFIGCDGELNVTAAEYMFNTYKIGSILDSATDHGGRWNTASPQRWANLTNSLQKIALRSGSKIPITWALISIKGANFVKSATMFPAPISVAASFNVEVAYNVSRITAKDTRAAGIQWALNPLVGINAHRAWSRNFESFGEDPYLVGEMTYSTVRGLQGNYKKDRTRLAATMRDFVGYSAPVSGKDRQYRHIPDNILMEYFVPPFKRAVEAGVATAANGFGSVNGEAVVSSSFQLQHILREVIDFKGVMLVEWEEIHNQVIRHGTAFNQTDAVHLTLNNTSIDMYMTPFNGSFVTETLYLSNNKMLSVDRIDESVGRILQMKKDLGLFENPYSDPDLIKTVSSKQDIDMARNAVRESIVLLQNNNDTLPLSLSENVLFIGPATNSSRYMGGGWNMHFMGPSDLEGDAIYDGYSDTVVSGVEKITGKKASWIQGYDIDGNQVDSIEDIISAAKSADKIVIGLGERTSAEFPGDVNTLKINPDLIKIIKKIHSEAKKPIVLLLIQGRPYLIEDLPSIADSILNANLPSMYGGLPTAEILYGKASPSGRQPFSYPKADYQNMINYYTYKGDEYDPEFAFGTGIGYSKIIYSDLTVNCTSFSPGNPISISVNVTNTGTMQQKEPVLFYTSQLIRRFYVPEQYRLRGFKKIDLAPNESQIVEFVLKAEDMSFYGRDLKSTISEGPVRITISAFNKNSVFTDTYLDI
ncbi:Lysosomal beta glucosidase [Smittium culicis]|uniref:beta-glucosidase n=1 Tax=Smittium culicis TaxID=133412 RepID=A0A1R1Y0L0_9FUNG|nr:Lysosomal beta glucosidase [Smittium culicis]